jgi:hypothetical protein
MRGIAVGLVLVSLFASAAKANVILGNGSLLDLEAWDPGANTGGSNNNYTYFQDTDSPAALPHTYSDTPPFPNFPSRNSSPTSYSYATYDFMDSSSPSAFQVHLDQARSGAVDLVGNITGGIPSRAFATGDVFFTVDASTAYSLSGSYSNDGASAGHFEVWLYDGALQLLDIDQRIENTPNLAVGPIAGVLQPGHIYDWGYQSDFATIGSGDGGGTATGFLGFAFSTPVPEPASLALAALGATAAAALRRARRRPL